MADVIQITDALDYLGIDFVDDVVTRNIKHAIQTADAYLKGSLGENYPIDDPRSKELAKIIVSDIYDKRGLIEDMTGNTRKLVNDMSWQIRLEMRRSNG